MDEFHVLHRTSYVWPAGEAAVECPSAGGAALDLAVRSGMAERGSADLVATAVNALLARGALPRTLAVTLAGGDAVVEDLWLGIERGCRAHAFTCVEAVRAPGGRVRVEVRARGARQQVLPGAASGNVVYAVAAPGLQGVGVDAAIAAFGGSTALDRACSELASTVRRALLTPTRSLAGVAFGPLREGCWRALVPVTDGGLLASVRAALPPGVGVDLDLATWELPPLHASLLRRCANDVASCAATFTLGVGMLFVTTEQHEARVLAELQGWREPHARLGRVTDEPGVRLSGTPRAPHTAAPG